MRETFLLYSCAHAYHAIWRLVTRLLVAIAAATVGIDQKSASGRIAGRAEPVPPAAYARHRKHGGVVADPEVDPPIIGGDIVDAIRRHHAEFRDGEVVHPHRLGLSLRTQLTAAIFPATGGISFPARRAAIPFARVTSKNRRKWHK
jgi:hypothetical protein